MVQRLRSGIGYDIHRLTEGEGPFRIGGVYLESPRVPVAHSDGDVLIHALIDALTGAAGLEDVGEMFPDNRSSTRGMDSREMLSRLSKILGKAGISIINLDAVVILENPRISPAKAAIRASLARILDIPFENCNVKGKSHEGIGETGAGRAAACHCTVLILLPG